MARVVDRTPFLDCVKTRFGNINTISRAQITEVCGTAGLDWPNWLTTNDNYRAGRGMYKIDAATIAANMPKGRSGKTEVKVAKVAAKPAPVSQVPVVSQPVEIANASDLMMANLQTTVAPVSLIPAKAKGYVPFGNFADVRSIISSNKFYPVYITGLSGNGKTMMIEQVCAALGRECIRANITRETDEDDLIGGFRLIDGRTVWQDGPVILAMERGAVLLLDEVDLGDSKLMCLQPVLEGKPIYVKKINRVVQPAVGFNVFATANTKGKGSDDGRFIGTNVMNEAFLERFSITMEQEYPALKVEQKILTNVLASSNIEDKPFVEKLVQWADVIRKSFYEGAVSEVISTRRLVHICEAYSIFGQDRMKAIQLCLNRFDVDTKTAFMDLYAKLDESANPKPAAAEGEIKTDEEIPF